MFNIYDKSKSVNGTILYDVTIIFQDIKQQYYELTAKEYTAVLVAFKILEKHKYREVKE